MILVRNVGLETYSFWSHNLEPGDAASEARDLRQRGIEALTLDQAESHDVVDPELCGECQKLLDRYLAERRGRQPPQDESFEG
jgi:hypothetical protein